MHVIVVKYIVSIKNRVYSYNHSFMYSMMMGKMICGEGVNARYTFLRMYKLL